MSCHWSPGPSCCLHAGSSMIMSIKLLYYTQYISLCQALGGVCRVGATLSRSRTGAVFFLVGPWQLELLNVCLPSLLLAAMSTSLQECLHSLVLPCPSVFLVWVETFIFLNQVCTSCRLPQIWFLKCDPVQIVSMRVCECVCSRSY